MLSVFVKKTSLGCSVVLLNTDSADFTDTYWEKKPFLHPCNPCYPCSLIETICGLLEFYVWLEALYVSWGELLERLQVGWRAEGTFVGAALVDGTSLIE